MTRHRIFLLAILLVAFFLRVWQLPQLPPGLWYDEAYNAMDAVWPARSGDYQIFFWGNNGREPLWHYLVLLATGSFGQTAFTVRWVGSMAGFLTVPVMYRFALVFLAPFAFDRRRQRWLALVAAGWLALSWWHLLNSRGGFRPVLLPPLLMLSLYFFWQGWSYPGRTLGSRRLAILGTGFLKLKSRPRPGLPPDESRNLVTVRLWPARVVDFVLAGFWLGLAQYTYLPARLAPLLYLGFGLVWTILAYRRTGRRPAWPYLSVGQLWSGLLITGLTAAVVFAPLGFFFLQNPEAFSSRTGDVRFSPDNPAELAGHLLQSVSLFLGAGHELYRHHLPGRAMLGWLEIPLFWLGLILLLATRRRNLPESQMTLIGLAVMWLPALLASPPVHSLRPIGLLPFYYLLVTVGSVLAAHWLAGWLWSRLRPRPPNRPAPVSSATAGWLAAAMLVITGLVNGYDYFWRWANRPEVYQEYNGPLADLSRRLIDLSETTDLLIPLHVYVHPTTRYLLDPVFTEAGDEAGPPLQRPLEMLIVPEPFPLLYVGNIPTSPALALLTRDEAGRGLVYVSRPPRAAEQVALNTLLISRQAQLQPFHDRLGRVVAQFLPLPEQSGDLLQPFFDATPLRTAALTWGDDQMVIHLAGYEVTPAVVQPGQPITLNLYWRSLTDETFDYRLFLQLIDGAGNPINQWEGQAVQEDMYRWRPDGLLPGQHTLWTGPDTPPGPYLVRLGFFDEETGARLPVRIGESTNGRMGESANGEWAKQSEQQTAADQVHLGLFYVSPDGADPRLPAIPLTAAFADSIKLIGVTLPQFVTIHHSPFTIHHSSFTIHNSLPVTLHWQARHPTAKPYTVFLQLLDEENQLVSSWDRQPFDGLYPTSLWSPGERIADTFYLPLPESGLSPGTYRLITGFYDAIAGERLPVTAPAGGGDSVELAEFVVVE